MDESADPTPADDSAGTTQSGSAMLKSTAVDRETEWQYRSGLYLASAGYDGFVKIWTADDWQLLRTLSTDSSKVMSVDLSGDGQLLVSGTYNRNFQLFTPE
jgi:U4/U6 small nuclear ribonucleoprotein PRP4